MQGKDKLFLSNGGWSVDRIGPTTGWSHNIIMDFALGIYRQLWTSPGLAQILSILFDLNRFEATSSPPFTNKLSITGIMSAAIKLNLLKNSIAALEFVDDLRCLEAMHGSSQPLFYAGTQHNLPKNDRLALYGDAAMQQVIARDWMLTTLPKSEISLPATHTQ